jgi:hypothetical protein
MLVRGTNVDIRVRGIIQEFSQLAHYDPIGELFNNPHQRFLNDKSIKDTLTLPKWTMPAQHAFESFDECEIHTGISQLIELRVREGEKRYSGIAACIPVPLSYNAFYKLYMAYTLTVTIDKTSQSLPALLEGKAVHVDFSTDANVAGAT